MPGSVSLRDLITHVSTRCCESLSYPSIADAVNVANSNADLLAYREDVWNIEKEVQYSTSTSQECQWRKGQRSE